MSLLYRITQDKTDFWGDYLRPFRTRRLVGRPTVQVPANLHVVVDTEKQADRQACLQKSHAKARVEAQDASLPVFPNQGLEPGHVRQALDGASLHRKTNNIVPLEHHERETAAH